MRGYKLEKIRRPHNRQVLGVHASLSIFRGDHSQVLHQKCSRSEYTQHTEADYQLTTTGIKLHKYNKK